MLMISGLEMEMVRANVELQEAAAILRDGGTVAFPTETVYGLGANALDPHAVARIFEIKQRPRFDPLIVHVSSVARSQQLVHEWPDTAAHVRMQLGEAVDRVLDGGPCRVGIESTVVALADDGPLLLRAGGTPVEEIEDLIGPVQRAGLLERLGHVQRLLDCVPTLYV